MSKFGSLAPSDKPHRVNIKLDGKQIFDKDGKPFFIDVYSEDSAAGRRFDKEQRDTAIANARNGVEQPSPLEVNALKCAALTIGWHLVDPETREPIDVPFTVEDAQDFYSRPLTAWIWGQAWAAANNHANFIKRSAKASTPMQSGTSEAAAS